MIDTVKLIIEKGKYNIVKPELFKPSFISSGFEGKLIFNPKSSSKRSYLPRVTWIKRKLRGGIDTPLLIEFSAPKLLYKNNIDELEDFDFEKVIEKLWKELKEFGIEVKKQDLKLAQVSAIHFSKNIILDNYYSPSIIIEQLAKIDITKRFDLTKDRYINNGLSFQIYSGTHSIVIYDKIKDIVQPKNRSIDRNKTPEEKDIYNFYKKTGKPLEILRIEIRLCKKRKIKEVLKEIGIESDVSFINLFRKDLSKKILKLYWKKFFIKNSYVNDILGLNPAELLNAISFNNPRNHLGKSLSIIGALAIIDERGMRGLREIVESHYCYKTWERLKKNIESISNNISSVNNGYMGYILNEIDKFESFKITNLKVSHV